MAADLLHLRPFVLLLSFSALKGVSKQMWKEQKEASFYN